MRCESVGMYLMLGALVESEAWNVLKRSLKSAVEENKDRNNLRGMKSQASGEQHLLTLLTMLIMGLFKPRDLTTYSGTGLGLLAGQGRPYCQDEMEHFILSGVKIKWEERLTADAARWATQLWGEKGEQGRDKVSYLYWDWHVKIVYSESHIPRTKHGTKNRIVGARKQLMLHDSRGHLLFISTYRGDIHLIEGMVEGGAYYEGLAESHRLTYQIFDREGLSVVYFKELIGDNDVNCQFTTYLRSNQYDGVDSFKKVGLFEPYKYDKAREVVEKIAEAEYRMNDRRKGEEDLCLRAILLQKCSRADKAKEKDKLHVMITSDQNTPAKEVATRYQARQTNQENAIRDWWLPLGGDVNIGYDKQPVENSELSKQKGKLQDSVERVKGYISRCEKGLKLLDMQHQKYTERYEAKREVSKQNIQKRIEQGEAQGKGALELYRWAKEEDGRVEKRLKPLCTRIEARAEQVKKEQEKREGYLKEQQEKEQILAEVTQAQHEHPMYELDNRKDQFLSVLRVFMVNVLQWLRDTVFPESYLHATYKTLVPFLQMGGFVLEGTDCLDVRFDGFWDSAKQQDLKEVVSRCNAEQFTAPDGRVLRFGICQKPGYV